VRRFALAASFCSFAVSGKSACTRWRGIFYFLLYIASARRAKASVMGVAGSGTKQLARIDIAATRWRRAASLRAFCLHYPALHPPHLYRLICVRVSPLGTHMHSNLELYQA